MEQVASAVRTAAASGRRALVGRVIELKGFSTLPVDEMVVVDDGGAVHGNLLGRPGAEKMASAAATLFDGPSRLATVPVTIHGPDVEELGLSCGGRADVLLQPASDIPAEFWAAVSARGPIALITVIAGSAASPSALAVAPDGRFWGELDSAVTAEGRATLIDEAVALLGDHRTAARRVETDTGQALVEAWVPAPRLVVVGGGDVVAAIEAQAALLGWEVKATDQAQVDELLDWAGSTAAFIVLSHDAGVDVPALTAALARDTPYIGAMGSRGTQSRRLERLAADGIPDEQLDRIHRPIGLDLGGRRAPEVALAIVAEILAGRFGRDGRSLRGKPGPIH
jgi:xanthine dehydrogenase accessory factor